LLSDRKTVREISKKEYLQKVNTKDKRFQLAWYDDDGLFLIHRKDRFWVKLVQLRQVLGDEP